ncbi:serine/threonine-protein kinase [Streptomyces sp. NBC_00094]|uniref:serine/threonine-protein kinase n=1 Tax=Streptomyces sp. NBC_00094 TaxID=2903620 RepID=UPI00224F9D53|nr:serine/threonine-protein kinase [Streptomyces sp. NBC_00094]MCX5388617.1 serine/threonine protein kinase [Streptomyces sp. NBC_00094]
MKRIGDYTVVRLLGSGGMGSVYLARSRSGRFVAIKVIRPEYAADPRFRERFRQEVEAARKVGGFHTAAVVDADPDAPQPWMASAYVEGPTLQAEVARRGQLSEEQLWRLAASLAEALKAIHGHGLVHRDLKPANIMLPPDGPRVLDFGIARALEESRLTTDGVVVGTAGYHSPEQALGRPVTGASDVFALGAVLVSASGGSAFGHGSPAGLMYRVVHEDPDVSTVPPSLRPVVLACLRKEPFRRPSPLELLDLCAAHAGAVPTHDATVLDDEPPPPTPPPPSSPHPPQPPTVTAENPSPPAAVYFVRRSAWFLQILRNALGVAGLVGGAVLSGTNAFPVAVPATAGVIAFLLAIRLLGLLGAAKEGLSLSSRGIGLGPPNNLVVMPWHEIKALELTRHTGWTELTVHLDVVRPMPTGAHHPTWVRQGRGGVTRIRARRLSPFGTAPQLPDAVNAFARWQRIRVNEG